jgi:fucose permease
MVASKERIFNWLSLCHSCFGIGSIIAPLVVSLFSKNAYVVAAVCIIITVPVYLFALRTPQEKQEEKLVN